MPLSDEALELKGKVVEATDFLKKLANPDRLLVACALVEGERSVRELEDGLGIRQPGLSQQLAELRAAGMVAGRKEGKQVFYRLADPRVETFVHIMHNLFSVPFQLSSTRSCTSGRMPSAMWPFSLFHNSSRRKIRKIDEQFSAAGQIRPDDIKALAEQGFVTIVCARPDNEQRDQPSFAEIAREARRYGMKAVHIPIGGIPSSDHIHRLKNVMATTDGPVLSYCRSGARSAALYLSIRR